MRALALAAALTVYGLFSTPAPAGFGPAEVTVALALLLAAGWAQPLAVATGHVLRRPTCCAPWEAVSVLSLAVLLWPPLLRGAALGWEPQQMARDVVPLLFLFLPVVLVPLLRPVPGPAVTLLAGGLATAGLAFALRWWHEMGWGFGAVGVRAMPEGTGYLLNAPSVLFAAVALPAAGLHALVRGGWQRLAAPALFVAGALCLSALAGAVHRMGLASAVVALAAVAVWWGRRDPRLVVVLLLAAAAAVWFASDLVLGALDQAVAKSRAAGINARGAEVLAVLAAVSADPVSMLVGEGWGARLANPAVGGWRVPYTHTLASYILFKAGLAGGVAAVAWLANLAPAALRLARRDPILAAAVLPPLAASLGVHTSFKYLDCGLLITLMVIASEKNPPSGRRL